MLSWRLATAARAPLTLTIKARPTCRVTTPNQRRQINAIKTRKLATQQGRQPSNQQASPADSKKVNDARTLISRLPENPEQALERLTVRGLERGYFRSSPEAMAILEAHADELRTTIADQQAAIAGPAQAEIQRIRDLLSAGKLSEANEALRQMPLRQQQVVRDEVAQLHQDIRAAIQGIVSTARRDIEAARTVNNARVALARAVAGNLPQATCNRSNVWLTRRLPPLNRPQRQTPQHKPMLVSKPGTTSRNAC